MIYEINKRHTLIVKALLISDTLKKDIPYEYFLRPMPYLMANHKSIIIYRNFCYSICFYSFGYLDGYNVVKAKPLKCNIKDFNFKSIIKRYNFKFGINN